MTQRTELSVCICSHNPRAQFLDRTLCALQAQTLARSRWELLLIDNASQPALTDRVDLRWHGNARILSEPELGLTAARLRAFSEAASPHVLLVDDDNVLAPEFLETTLAIAGKHPELGAWGASIEGEFETAVPKWLERELLFLAVRPIQKQQIALSETPGFPTPAGAGMTVHRRVFERYAEHIQQDPFRRELDRKGSSLISAGDTDLSLCAWELGLGLGNFPELRLTHLIPRGRMTPAYLARLHESMAYSAYAMKRVRGEDALTTVHSPVRIVRTLARELLHARWQGARFFLSQVKGARKAHRHFSAVASPESGS